MNKIKILLFFFVFLLPSSLFAESFYAKVIWVTDGDTIWILHNGKKEKIRLAEIDCPEKDQAFGMDAKQFTFNLIFKNEIQVIEKSQIPYRNSNFIKNITQDEFKDSEGRTVGEIILSDGRNLNRELIKAGLAWWYQRYSNNPSLGKLEEEARKSKRGLWVDPHPTPPWEFRLQKRLSAKNLLLHYAIFRDGFVTEEVFNLV